MPLYEYHCDTCGEDFEEVCKIGCHVDNCPYCGTPKPRRVVSQSSFRLKGGGWEKDKYTKP